jgi:hypothetical protein
MMSHFSMAKTLLAQSHVLNMKFPKIMVDGAINNMDG